tara:strand:+ start:12121 stop:13212 length:1092 start_codon:yes stop_codon:yes gene_type:complete
LNNLKRIIWLQSIFSEEFVKKSAAVSPAANIWQYNFIKNLKKLNIEIYCVGHNYEQAFPSGKLFVKVLKKNLVKDIENKSFNYINLPYLRDFLLKKKYYDFLKNFYFQKGDVIVTYNDSFISDVALKIKTNFDVEWISIVADLKAPNKASGYIYFNWEYYKKNKNKNALHIDGGVNSKSSYLLNKKKNEKKIILYAGTIGGHAGVSYLINAFHHVKDANAELWLCGKGNYFEIKKLVEKDNRIKFFGYVSRTQLEEKCRQTDIFVNPRKTYGNDTNFPSKILFYLSFKKPIISTRSGLSPKYNSILFLLNDEKITTLTKKIELLLSLNLNKKKDLKYKIIDFNKKNSWDAHVKKFIIWLNKKL